MANLFTVIPEDEMDSRPSLQINIPGKTPSLNDSSKGMSFKLNSIPEDTKRKPAKKSTPKKANMGNVVTATVSDPAYKKDEMLTTDKPYATKYDETTNWLKGSIAQLDMLLGDTLTDASQIRSSKTLKRKYDLLSLLNNNASSIIGNKITAIREINNTINKCNDLELRRMKELNMAAAGQDSDKKIMDMYSAFISMPTGAALPGAPNLQNIAQSLSMGNVVTGTVMGEDDAAYQNYINNMNPAQRLNMYEGNPNVKQVVVYNQQNGSRYFEVMDVSTGEVIPGVDKHDAMFLENTTLDLENKIARNIDLGETYPIVIVGEPVMNMY